MSAMPDLRWVRDGAGFTDYLDAEGMIHGYIGPVTAGVRGYVFDRRPDGRPSYSAITDHPTDAAARVHVEAEVARIHGGGGAA
jgi:hypothetical protein